jgi:hypothetical protein
MTTQHPRAQEVQFLAGYFAVLMKSGSGRKERVDRAFCTGGLIQCVLSDDEKMSDVFWKAQPEKQR